MQCGKIWIAKIDNNGDILKKNTIFAAPKFWGNRNKFSY